MWRAVLLVVAVACGPTQSVSDEPKARGFADVLSKSDRCSLLPQCEHGEAVETGCPEPFFGFKKGSATLQSRTLELLEQLATELTSTPAPARYVIRGSAGTREDEEIAAMRAEVIREWLVEAGVSDRRLDTATATSTRADAAYATVEILSCGDAGDSAVDSAPAGAYLLILM